MAGIHRHAAGHPNAEPGFLDIKERDGLIRTHQANIGIDDPRVCACGKLQAVLEITQLSAGTVEDVTEVKDDRFVFVGVQFTVFSMADETHRCRAVSFARLIGPRYFPGVGPANVLMTEVDPAMLRVISRFAGDVFHRETSGDFTSSGPSDIFKEWLVGLVHHILCDFQPAMFDGDTSAAGFLEGEPGTSLSCPNGKQYHKAG